MKLSVDLDNFDIHPVSLEAFISLSMFEIEYFEPSVKHFGSLTQYPTFILLHFMYCICNHENPSDTFQHYNQISDPFM